jgi:hypothetical protein
MRLASRQDMMLSSSSLVSARNRSMSCTFSSLEQVLVGAVAVAAPARWPAAAWLRYSQRCGLVSMSLTWLACELRARRRPTLPPPAIITRRTGWSRWRSAPSTLADVLGGGQHEDLVTGSMRVLPSHTTCGLAEHVRR